MAGLDFSTVIDRDVFGVHLKTQSQSDLFLDEIERQYGFRFRNRKGYWSESKGETVYVVRKNKNNPLTYTDCESAKEAGYYVVEFDELTASDFEVADVDELMDLIGIKI